MTERQLGVCYYPEHWPEAQWADDARRMAELGLTYVRIAEFAWHRMEPSEGNYDFGWLDRAIETLGAAGLKVVLCTPTPTPPKWLTDAYPQVLFHHPDGRVSKHGSRRHVSVASATYRGLSAGITAQLVARYGQNPHVAGWQTDNEYGCHESTLSYGAEDRQAFGKWLEAKYGDVAALNLAWGNAFWSQTYNTFAEIDLPNNLVTDANPAHWLDFRRFFSDMTVEFNAEQCALIREGSPDRFITHNCMLFETGFDHWKIARDLDFISWDSYPLGFMERVGELLGMPEEIINHYGRSGHPDLVPFHHDLYRSMGQGKWANSFWVMEQQPGPVNWSSQNPAPHDGMVKFWTDEAMAHGAQTVSYFRWRQAPWSQEQMHTGINTAWNSLDQAGIEVRDQVLPALSSIEHETNGPAHVALFLDWEATWFVEGMKQGSIQNGNFIVFQWYQALRELGLNVTFFGPHMSTFEGVKDATLYLFPLMAIDRPQMVAAAKATGRPVLFGARSGSRTADVAFEANDPLGDFSPLKAPPYITDGSGNVFGDLAINRVESLRRSRPLTVAGPGNQTMTAVDWVEHLVPAEGQAVQARFDAEQEGVAGLQAAWVQQDNAHYLGFMPDVESAKTIIRDLAKDSDLPLTDLPQDVRVRRFAESVAISNYGATPVSTHCVDANGGEQSVQPRTISIRKVQI